MSKTVIGLVLLIAFLSPPSALPCSCGEKDPPAVALENSTAVFSGEVISIELAPLWWEVDATPPARDLLMDGGDRMVRVSKVTVRVGKVWKGATSETHVVYSAFDCCMCGIGFRIGQHYLFYSYSSTGRQEFVSDCDRTAPLEKADADLKELPASIADYETERFARYRELVLKPWRLPDEASPYRPK